MIHKIKKYPITILLVACSLFYLAAYFYIALSRITYPFEIEWMEGGSVDHVRRILLGQPLYVEPSLDFVPYIYTPFYYYVSAFFSKLFGLGFFSLRLVSLLSSLGIIVLLYKIVFLETKDHFSSLIASGLFTATFRLSGAWMDIARVDSLFLFLFFLGFYFLFYRKTISDTVIASILIFLSFFTKQSTLMMVLPLSITLLAQSKKRVLIFSIFLITFVGSSTLIMDHLSDGWYSYYVFKLPKLHAWVPEAYINYWKYDLGGPFLLASIIGLAGLFYGSSEDKSWKDQLHLKTFLLGAIGASWLSRLHSGGYDNVLMPAYLGITLLASCFENKNFKLKSVLNLFLFIQFSLLYYPIQNQIPTQADINAGHAFIEQIKNLPEKDVYIPFHPYFSILAGKEKTGAQLMAIDDILRVKDHPQKTKFYQSIKNDLLNRTRPAIVLDNNWFPQELDQNYSRGNDLFLGSHGFFPLTGASTRPRWIYRLRESPQ
ncbi:MAG: glycosyltransferase family 39 protein [Deltaproteobacteria bacterium]|nr:MAG: glycosyltransferase family 39 protein [Deltaproteobacteria bacterium]